MTPEERGQLMKTYLRTSTQGLEIGLSVVVGAMLGFWADRHWGTQPWGMLIGLFFGCVTAGRKAWRLVKRMQATSPDGPDVPGDYDDRP
jgi:F0F1-type ATP synthase assembly protein I